MNLSAPVPNIRLKTRNPEISGNPENTFLHIFSIDVAKVIVFS